MADEKKTERAPTAVPSSNEAQLQALLQTLQSENSALKSELAKSGKTSVAPPLPKTSGTFTSPRPHYRAGRYYLPGEPITIKDEVPGRTWERVAEGMPAHEAPKEPAQGLRPSDRPII